MKPGTHIRITFCLIAFCIFTDCSLLEAQLVTPELLTAFANNDLEAVKSAVADGFKALGKKAGEPEAPDEFRRVPRDAKILLTLPRPG
jgi:hypothetical protein